MTNLSGVKILKDDGFARKRAAIFFRRHIGAITGAGCTAHIAFTRGAARQYDKPWLMDFSSWYAPSIFDEDPRRTWGENSGPTHGHSLSLHLRTYIVSYMAGANVVVAEGGALNCFPATGSRPRSSAGARLECIFLF